MSIVFSFPSNFLLDVYPNQNGAKAISLNNELNPRFKINDILIGARG